MGEEETFTIVDRWGDQWVCYTCVEYTDEFFLMYPPDDVLHSSPQAFCTRCKENTGKGKLFQKHIVDKALYGKEIPANKKCSFMELQRRWIVQDSESLEKLRREYSEVNNNMPEGIAKELLLKSIKDNADGLKAGITEAKQFIARKLIHG